MIINITLKIDEEVIQDILERFGKSKEEFRKILTKGLEEDISGIIEDNWELFDEVRFTVD